MEPKEHAVPALPEKAEYQELLNWLYSVQQFGIKPGLDNTRKLLKALHLPGSGQRFIHVAGTNGKGSTCAFIDSILRAGGERTALFTSPHLIQFRERIRTGGVMIPEKETARSLGCLRDLLRGWDPHPTFFELTLALALDWFDRRGSEWVVLETGMGGRLDATNAVKPAVSVITPIAMDHQQWLGSTLTAIAGEKAGIIKPGVPVVSAPQTPEARKVLETAALAAGADLEFVSEPLTNSPLSLPGPHQQWNAALAVAALRAAGCLPKPPAVAAGLASTVWPARFQILREGPDGLILDGAHNPHSIAGLVDAWRAKFGAEKARLVFGTVEGKDHAASLPLLAPLVAEAEFVTLNSPRAIPAETLAAAWRTAAPDISCRTAPSLHEALAPVLFPPGQDQPALFRPARRTLVCGSLYLCGEVLSIAEKTSFESSAQ